MSGSRCGWYAVRGPDWIVGDSVQGGRRCILLLDCRTFVAYARGQEEKLRPGREAVKKGGLVMRTYLGVVALFVRVVLGLFLVGVSLASGSDYQYCYLLLGILFLDGSYREWRLWKLEDTLLERNRSAAQQNGRSS
jgi:hypothetical protein